MIPKKPNHGQGELFEVELQSLVKKNHPLVKLSKDLDWERFDREFGQSYCPTHGRPGIATRLMVGLIYLKYLYNLSDEALIAQWLENPYWQYFCGERYFQHEGPCDRSHLSRWRKRIGESGAQLLLSESLSLNHRKGFLKLRDLNQVYVDTTVQEKHISYPSQASLLNKAREKLVKMAESAGLKLRQSYKRVGRLYMIKAHRYASARQWNRARKQVRKLRTLLGRIVREVQRKANQEQGAYFSNLLSLSQRLLCAETGSEKLYSLHEPQTEAIAKGKMYKPFEYGVKVSVVTTRRGGYVLGCKAIHGNPYDGHTLEEALSDAQNRLGRNLRGFVGVDLGYRGHGVKRTTLNVFHPRLKRMSKVQRTFVRARSKVEAAISYLKRCFRMGRNFLKGSLGDIMNPLFAAAACNLSHAIRRSSA